MPDTTVERLGANGRKAKRISTAELDQLRRLIAANPAASRAQVSRLVCAELGWSRDELPRGDAAHAD